MPEFYEADINLLFHKLQAGYCFKHVLWCIKCGTERNTNKRIPSDTKQGWALRKNRLPSHAWRLEFKKGHKTAKLQG